jgi:hypothetical protein
MHPDSYVMGAVGCRLRLKGDGTRSETRFRLSPKRTSPFKSAGASVQSTDGSRGVRISVSNAGYTTFQGSVKVLATHFIRQFPLHFPSRASPCAIMFKTHSTRVYNCWGRRFTEYSSFSSAEFKSEMCCMLTPPIFLHNVHRDTFSFTLYPELTKNIRRGKSRILPVLAKIWNRAVLTT